MQRKTDRSRGKWNPEKHRLEASEKPSAPRGTRVSQVRISQDFGLPHHWQADIYGARKKGKAPSCFCPFRVFSVAQSMCCQRQRVICLWVKQAPRGLYILFRLYLLCACVCQVKFRGQLQALPWLCSSTMCVLETDLHYKTWRHMLSPLHILLHLPELLGVCICGLLFLEKVQVFKKEKIKWLIMHLNQKSMWTHWGLWGSFCLFHSKHAYNLFQPSV